MSGIRAREQQERTSAEVEGTATRQGDAISTPLTHSVARKSNRFHDEFQKWQLYRSKHLIPYLTRNPRQKQRINTHTHTSIAV